jgi:hypothetical protein
MLARRSHELLDAYRRGEPVAGDCPLKKALTVPTLKRGQQGMTLIF